MKKETSHSLNLDDLVFFRIRQLRQNQDTSRKRTFINALWPSDAYSRQQTSDNGLSPGWRQAIIWTYAGILLIRTLETNISEISSEIKNILTIKCIRKCRRRNGGNFVSVSMSFDWTNNGQLIGSGDKYQIIPKSVNSVRPGDAYIHQQAWSLLFQIMACRIVSLTSLSCQDLTYG